MAYSREEQETTMVFDNSTGKWSVYSTVQKHIRKLAKLTEFLTLESENDKPIAIKCELTEKMVRINKERVVTDEQREKAKERFSKSKIKI